MRRADTAISRPPWGLGLTYIVAGTLHFLIPKRYEAIMPPQLPAHRELVLISGAAEIVGGAGALHPRTRRLAGWWLVALLVAVFPANVHMARKPDEIKGLPPIPRWALWARLPLQGIFIYWALRATRPATDPALD